MAIEISESLLGELDIAAATRFELETPHQLVPSRLVEHGLRQHSDSVAEYLEGLFRGGIEPVSADVLRATKAGRGYRPLHLLPLPERVLYLALANRATRHLADFSRDFENWQKVHESPLSIPSASYIGQADVASFYQYIDHSFLREELIAQTGIFDVPDALEQLLHSLMLRRFGLPQTSYASDRLSEVVIDIVERRMLRQGFAITRFNDDFVIASESWGDASLALERLDGELGLIGLTLNDQKSVILKRKTFEEWIHASEKAWADIADAVSFDFQDFDPYTGLPRDDEDVLLADEAEEDGELEELPSEEEIVEAANRAVAYWKDQVEERSAPVRVFRRLLSQALSTLAAHRSPDALDECWNILRVEPQFAPLIGRYLRRVAESEPAGVRRLLKSWLVDEKLWLSEWQRLWVLEGAFALDELTKPIRAWLDLQVTNHDVCSTLRARAAVLLALNNGIEPARLASLYSEVHPAAQPDIVLALSALATASDPLLRSVLDDSPLNRLLLTVS